MATLSALHAGLATRLATITSLKGTYREGDAQVETPGAVVRYGSPLVTYNTSTGTHDYNFSVLLLESVAAGATAQDALDSYLDPTGADSVYAAVDGDPTLGGAAHAAVVTSCQNAGVVAWGGVEYLGAELLITIYA